MFIANHVCYHQWFQGLHVLHGQEVTTFGLVGSTCTTIIITDGLMELHVCLEGVSTITGVLSGAILTTMEVKITCSCFVMGSGVIGMNLKTGDMCVNQDCSRTTKIH